MKQRILLFATITFLFSIFVSSCGKQPSRRLDCRSCTAGLTYGAAFQEAYAACPVLSNPSTEGFFQVFSDFAAATELSCSIMGSSIQLPRIQDFSVSERFPAQGGMSSVPVSPELLRASFSQNGLEGEGLFSANVVPFAVDMYGYYMAYDILLMSAEKDQFQNWEGLLTQSLHGIPATKAKISFVRNKVMPQWDMSASLTPKPVIFIRPTMVLPIGITAPATRQFQMTNTPMPLRASIIWNKKRRIIPPFLFLSPLLLPSLFLP